MCFILSKSWKVIENCAGPLSPRQIPYISLVWGFRWRTVSLGELLEADKEGGWPPSCWTRRGLKAHKARCDCRHAFTHTALCQLPTSLSLRCPLGNWVEAAFRFCLKHLTQGGYSTYCHPLTVRRPERRVMVPSLNHRAGPEPANLHS